jgi:hypothetical protein
MMKHRRAMKKPPEVIGRGTFQGLCTSPGELQISYRVPLHVLIRPETRERFAAYWEGGQAFTNLAGDMIRGPLHDVKAAVRARFIEQHGPWVWTADGTPIDEPKPKEKTGTTKR